MPSLLLALVLAAAASPRAPRAATSVVHLPRLDKTGPLMRWMTHAGQRAPVLRPQGWEGDFHPLLHVDFTRAESLEQNGLSPSGSATISQIAESRMTCATLADPERYTQLSAQRLAARGTLVRQRLSGLPVLAAQIDGEWVAGVVVKGRESCAVTSPHATRALLQEAIRLLGSSAVDPRFRGADLSRGALWVSTGHGPISLDAVGESLDLQGRLTEVPLAALEPGGVSPFARAPASGLLFTRSHLARAGLPQLADLFASQVRVLCPACESKAVSTLGAAIAAHLTGHLLLRVDRFQPGDELHSPAGRLSALKLAALAELDDGPAVARLLSKGSSWPGARAVEGGVALLTPSGTLTLGVRDRLLFLANDTQALQAVLDLPLGAPAPLPHPLELVVDPRKVTEAFSRLSLLDVVGSRELAALYAVGVEIGPVFASTARLTGEADPAGAALKAHLGWTLATPAPRGDSGDPAGPGTPEPSRP